MLPYDNEVVPCIFLKIAVAGVAGLCLADPGASLRVRVRRCLGEPNHRREQRLGGPVSSALFCHDVKGPGFRFARVSPGCCSCPSLQSLNSFSLVGQSPVSRGPFHFEPRGVLEETMQMSRFPSLVVRSQGIELGFFLPGRGGGGATDCDFPLHRPASKPLCLLGFTH